MLKNLNDQTLLNKTNHWIQEEKRVGAEVLKHLLEVHRRKLYCELGYPSLFKMLTQYYKLSEAQANVRVRAVDLMARNSQVEKKISEGKLGTTQAAIISQGLNQLKQLGGELKNLNQLLDKVEGKSCRQTENIIEEELKLPRKKSKLIKINEFTLEKIEKLKAHYGDLDEAELFDILCAEKLRELNTPAKSRQSKGVHETSRQFSASVKRKKMNENSQCENCGSRQKLELDHQLSYARGGKSTDENARVLCRSCNLREAVKTFGRDHMQQYMF